MLQHSHRITLHPFTTQHENAIMPQPGKKQKDKKRKKREPRDRDQTRWHVMLSVIGLLLVVVIYGVVHFQRATAPSFFVGSKTATTVDATTNASIRAYDMAFNESYGFFDDITNEAWLRRKQWAKDFRKDLKFDDHFIQSFAGEHFVVGFEPYFACPEKLRIGGVGDGPKWICDIHRLKDIGERRWREAQNLAGNSNDINTDYASKIYSPRKKHGCLVYSIGSSGDYSFEDGVYDAMGGPTCEIHTFDPTKDYDRVPTNAERNIHFHQWGFKGTKLDRNGEFYLLPEIVKRLGHEGRVIDLFKIDCEGCEWFSHEDFTSYTNIRQIMIEVHKSGGINAERIFQFFDNFAKNGMVMYSKELNFYNPSYAVEFSFLRVTPSFFDDG